MEDLRVCRELSERTSAATIQTQIDAINATLTTIHEHPDHQVTMDGLSYPLADIDNLEQPLARLEGWRIRHTWWRRWIRWILRRG